MPPVVFIFLLPFSSWFSQTLKPDIHWGRHSRPRFLWSLLSSDIQCLGPDWYVHAKRLHVPMPGWPRTSLFHIDNTPSHQISTISNLPVSTMIFLSQSDTALVLWFHSSNFNPRISQVLSSILNSEFVHQAAAPLLSHGSVIPTSTVIRFPPGPLPSHHF